MRPVPAGSRVQVQITHPTNPYKIEIPNGIDIDTLHHSSRIKIVDSCYEPDELPIETELAEEYYLNWSNAGVGFLVDYATGEMWRYRRMTTVPVTKNPDCGKEETPSSEAADNREFEEEASLLDSKDGGLDEGSAVPSGRVQASGTEAASGDLGSFTQGFLEYLGGVQLKYLYGLATVRSYVENDGQEEEIANGDAEYTGYELSFRKPFVKTGWSYFMHPRYLSQSITIGDFQESLPVREKEGSQTIPVVVTDYETGLVVDPDDPNTYDIRMSSWGFAATGQYNWAKECRHRDCRLFGEIALGVGLLEETTVDVKLGNRSEKETEWKWAQSYSLGGAVGMLQPAWNSALQISVSYIYYPNLKLPDDIEFRHKVTYNREKDIFERRRVFIDEVELIIGNVQLTYTYIF